MDTWGSEARGVPRSGDPKLFGFSRMSKVGGEGPEGASPIWEALTSQGFADPQTSIP